MCDVKLKDLLKSVGEKADVHLSFRRKPGETWQRVVGCKGDKEIARWMDCDVVKMTWERGEPSKIQIAVEGEPND